MAIVKDNIVVSGLQGMVGNKLVFRTVRGKPLSRAGPVRRNTIANVSANTAFAFAKSQDLPALLYTTLRKNNTTHTRPVSSTFPMPTAALTGYLRKPSIDNIKREGQHGNLSVTASKKDFALASVEITLAGAQGGAPDHNGGITQKPLQRRMDRSVPPDFWKFNNTLSTAKAWIVAKDPTGNVIRKEIPTHPLSPQNLELRT